MRSPKRASQGRGWDSARAERESPRASRALANRHAAPRRLTHGKRRNQSIRAIRLTAEVCPVRPNEPPTSSRKPLEKPGRKSLDPYTPTTARKSRQKVAEPPHRGLIMSRQSTLPNARRLGFRTPWAWNRPWRSSETRWTATSSPNHQNSFA